MWEIFKHKSVKVKIKLDNMDQVMGIVKLNEFDFFYEKSCGIWITIRNFGSRKQEPKTESRNLIIVLCSFSISKEKIDQNSKEGWF